MTSREQIEHAAQNLSSRTQSIREHSEQTLLSFRKSPEALYLCQDILINSQSIDAKFQASNALRFAILQKWDVMTNDMRAEIRQFCLKYLLHSQTTTETSSSSSRMSNVISSQIVSVLAVVLKRQWLDDDGKQRQMALEECERAVSSSATAGGTRGRA